MNRHHHTLDSAPRVLLVIDQPVLAQYVALALNHGISQTQVAENPDVALAAISTWRPHLIIIDMDLARGAILDQLGYTAPSTKRLPAIALTRRGDLQTKLAAFDHGVDDILTVPFSPEELVARMLAVMRRTYHELVTFTPVLRLGDLEIDILNRLVRVHGKDLHLTSVEQSLLYLLAANAGQLLTRDEILDQLWGVDYVVLAGQATQADLNVGVATMALDQQGQDVAGQVQRDHGGGSGKDPLQRGLGAGFPGIKALARDLDVSAQGADEAIFVVVCKHLTGPLYPLVGRARMPLTHTVLPVLSGRCGTSTIQRREFCCKLFGSTVKLESPILKHA